MKHPLIQFGAALTFALSIASCGGPATPTDTGNKPPATEQPGAELPPVKGGTIAVPADATAANEFVVTGVRARALAQSLGYDPDALNARIQTAALAATDLRPQAAQDELRILVTVNRAKSGTNAGKKKAQATFVWGNQTELVQTPTGINPNDGKIIKSPGVWIQVYPQGNEYYEDNSKSATFNVGESTMELRVESPNFQDKTTKSSPYIADVGATCAKLQFNMSSARNDGTTTGYTPMEFRSSASGGDIEVCEGVADRDAEKVALEKAAKGMTYEGGGILAGPFSYTRWDGKTIAALTDADLRTRAGAATDAQVDTATFDDWFAPQMVLPTGDKATWTPEQKAQAAKANKFIALKKQFGYYFKNAVVKTVKNGANRDDIFIVGENGWGVGGLRTLVIR